ncbi:MAG: hypothetical protein V2B17_03485 [Chloroflexota bacterium]
MPVPTARRRALTPPRSTGRGRATVADDRDDAGAPPVADPLTQLIAESPVDLGRLDPATTARFAAALQRLAGNAAVHGAIVRRGGPVAQRIPVGAAFRETLLTTPEAGEVAGGAGGYTAAGYALGAENRYQITRDAQGVRVEVRIYFRDPGGGPIPDGDTRRGDASGMCSGLVTQWNDRFEFVGRRRPPAGGPTDAGVPAGTGPAPGTPAAPAGPGGAAAALDEIRLPVRYLATPVFDPAAERDATVTLRTNVATGEAPTGGPYGVIDAGNWFTSIDRRVYPADPNVIYAHEYGHLLGIPDEYSLSNAEMHNRIHGAYPIEGTGAADDLDSQATRVVLVRAIVAQLKPRLRGAATQIARIVAGQRSQLVALLARTMRSGWRDGSTTAGIASAARTALAGRDRALRAVPGAVAFEARQNRSYFTDAQAGFADALDPANFGQLLETAFENAAETAISGGQVTLGPEPGRCTDRDMTIRVGTRNLGSDATLTASATSAANAIAGANPAPAPGARPPRVSPSSGLLERIAALPGTWSNLQGAFEAEATRLPNTLVALATSAISDPSFAAGVDNSPANLYRQLLAVFGTVSATAASATFSDFFAAQVQPTMRDQSNELVTLVGDEIGLHSTVPAGGGTSAGTVAAPDPAAAARTQAIAAAIETGATRARAMATAAAPANLAPGARQTTDVNVRYSVEGMMGSNASPTGALIRTDHLSGMVGAFNTNSPALRHADEENFTVRRRV